MRLVIGKGSCGIAAGADKVSDSAVSYIAEKGLNIPVGVTGCIGMCYLEPIGKYLIMICQGTACHVNGSEAVQAAIEEYLEIKDGQTTPDGLFSIKSVACLGCCSLSPVMMINGEAYGTLTPDKAKQILADIKAKEAESK